MNLKKILKNKRGVALENTLLFMLVIFSLCALLTNLTLIGHYQTRINKLTLENEVELEQIGEDFIAVVAAKQEFTQKEYDNYIAQPVASTDTKAMVVWHKNDTEHKAAALYVEAKLDEYDNVQILYWCYSLPPHVN